METLSIQGILLKKLNPESGVRKDGRGWKKQNFILKTDSNFNNEICFQLFGEDKIEMLNHHDEGDQVEVSFNLSSKEFNGRYFHNIDAWRIENITKQTAENKIEDPKKFNSSSDEEDDLPF